jgi:hypothetical protein
MIHAWSAGEQRAHALTSMAARNSMPIGRVGISSSENSPPLRSSDVAMVDGRRYSLRRSRRFHDRRSPRSELNRNLRHTKTEHDLRAARAIKWNQSESNRHFPGANRTLSQLSYDPVGRCGRRGNHRRPQRQIAEESDLILWCWNPLGHHGLRPMALRTRIELVSFLRQRNCDSSRITKH